MSEIKPALTGEQQQAESIPLTDTQRGWVEESIGWTAILPDGSHTYFTRFQAAMGSLHEQPFGFTREDAMALRSMGNGFEGTGSEPLDRLIAGYVAKIQSVADRIEALLPPEENHAKRQHEDTDNDAEIGHH